MERFESFGSDEWQEEVDGERETSGQNDHKFFRFVHKNMIYREMFYKSNNWPFSSTPAKKNVYQINK